MRSSILCALLACCAAVCLHAQQYGTDYVSQVENKPALDPRQFQFNYVSGGPFVTGDLSTPGSNTLTLAVGPLGVSGTDVNHYLYVSGGTGTAEPPLITGGTCTPGAIKCTLIITTANAHTGAWTLGSATIGIQEAYNSCSGPCTVLVPYGNFTIHGPITTPVVQVAYYTGYGLRGYGRFSSRLNVASDFPMSALGIVVAGFDGVAAHADDGPSVEDLGFILPQNYSSTNIGTFTQWPPLVYSAGPAGLVLKRLYISGAWVGFHLHGYPDTATSPTVWTGQHVIDDVQMGAWHTGIDLLGSADIIRVSKFHMWPFTDISNPTLTNQTAFWDPSVTGIVGSYLAGLYISDSFFISGTAMNLSGSVSLLNVVNTDFDAFGAITLGGAAGAVEGRFTNTHFFMDASLGTTSVTCSRAAVTIPNSGSEIAFVNSWWSRACAQPIISITAPSGTNYHFAQVEFSNNFFYDSSNSTSVPSMISLNGSAGGPLAVIFDGNHFAYSNNLTYSNPMLSITGGNMALQFTNNVNSGTGNGTWLSIAAENTTIGGHNVQGNVLGGWTASLPCSNHCESGVYQDANFDYPLASATQNVNHAGSPWSFNGFRDTKLCNASAGLVNVTLPFARNAFGAEFTITKEDSSSNQCAFVVGSGDTINGSSSSLAITTQYQGRTLKSDGVTGWWTVSGIN